MQKRLVWAQQQVSNAAAPGLFDVTVQSDSPQAAYRGLQQAVATLSPAVRHKLQGLPADVLDYADLIAGTSVEQPVLKPVLIAGERGLLACQPVQSHRLLLSQHASILRACMLGACNERLQACFCGCGGHIFTSKPRCSKEVSLCNGVAMTRKQRLLLPIVSGPHGLIQARLHVTVQMSYALQNGQGYSVALKQSGRASFLCR